MFVGMNSDHLRSYIGRFIIIPAMHEALVSCPLFWFELWWDYPTPGCVKAASQPAHRPVRSAQLPLSPAPLPFCLSSPVLIAQIGGTGVCIRLPTSPTPGYQLGCWTKDSVITVLYLSHVMFWRCGHPKPLI